MKYAYRLALLGLLILGALGACSGPPAPLAGCWLRYVPPPAEPLSSSSVGQPTTMPAPGACLLELPDAIAQGGTLSIAPEAYAAAEPRQ